MKANQAFRNADEAVSPVIGVILMVAITVVLAAVVFVLVSGLSGDQKDQAPSVTFAKTEAPDGLGATFQVVAADSTAGEWTGYELLQAGSTTTTCTPLPTSGAVTAGNIIDCDSTAGTDPVDGTAIQLRHKATNTLITVGTV